MSEHDATATRAGLNVKYPGLLKAAFDVCFEQDLT